MFAVARGLRVLEVLIDETIEYHAGNYLKIYEHSSRQKEKLENSFN